MNAAPRARSSSRPPTLLVALFLLASASPAGALAGTVVDTRKQPIAGAQVCYLLAGEEKHCVGTDETGAFELPPSQIDTLRVIAEGYLPRVLPAVEQRSPIVLDRAPTLSVRLVDAANGEPIERGQLFVVYPSGVRKGPFPVNRAGVRVRRVLDPGPVRLLAEAEGFAQPAPEPATLVGGEEIEVVLRLPRSATGKP